MKSETRSMPPDDPRVIALARAIVALIDGASLSATDELVPLTPEALAALGLEHRPVVRLVERGELASIKIGRRRYTRRSWLAQLAEKTPIVPSRPAVPKDDLLDAVRKRAARLGGRP